MAGGIKRRIMKLSARNILKGRIKRIKRGPISGLVVLEIVKVKGSVLGNWYSLILFPIS